jgi:helicase-exonuclease AddAB, AddA subunit, Firmicutes type
MEQTEAITQNGCNLLVAAAAGSGKTAVLVERIIRKIIDPVNPLDIDKLLVVTFTNAAAMEMRERIGLALEKALDGNPQSGHLQRQLALLDKASITTLHSFCLNVVKSNFHILELDPVFRIAEETETTLMKLDILEELFDDKYEDTNTDKNFYKLVECYGGGKSDQGLQEMVISLFEFIQSHPWPERWLEEHVEELRLPADADLCRTPWGSIILQNVAAELEGLVSILEEALMAAGGANGLGPYVSCLENDMDQLIGLQSSLKCKQDTDVNKWDEISKAFKAFSAARLPRCGKDADIDAQEKVKAARKLVKDGIAKIAENAFCSTASEIIQDLECLYPLFRTLSALVLEFGLKYTQLKRDKALLDFNDLEHLCLELLVQNGTKTPVAIELGGRNEEILVDEYQDSNLIQEVIINAISREEYGKPNIFMVGDVKQSIYRFRQARPDLFLSKYNRYPDTAGSGSLRVLLYKNFRSRPEVINGVNFIFKQIMSRYVGELDYTDNEALNPGAVFADVGDDLTIAGGPVEVDIIDLSGNTTDSTGVTAETNDYIEPEEVQAESDDILQSNTDESEQLDSIQQEARLVARRIKQLVDSKQTSPIFKVFDNKQKCYRKAEYKDIVILLRTTRNWADVFAEELALQGIPAFTDAGSGYFKTVEIQTMISLLQIIDNPLQDIPLLSVLRSPMFLFSADELADIRLVDRNLPFFESIKKYVADNSGEFSEKCTRFLLNLERWRDKAQYSPIDEFIWYLYTETSYYSYVGILPGGNQRQANLRMLFERARQYEDTSYKGLFNFVNFIDRLKSGGGDFGSAKILGENENVVRIMSIHKSKGLEFPIVFVSGCGKKFNLQDMNGKVLLHQDLGFGPDLVDIERRITYPVATKQAIKYKIRQETLSEEMRILYVAFTRAKEKLIITGTVKDLARSVTNWNKCACKPEERLSEFDMLRAGTYLDWICPALIRHRDGEALRLGSANTADECSSTWDIRLCNPETAGDEASNPKNVDELKAWLLEAKDNAADNTAFKQITNKLEWNYKYEYSSGVPAKFSVTELKRRFRMGASDEQQPSELYLPPLAEKPAFMDGIKGYTSAEKGTITHFVMQHLELNAIRQAMCDAYLNRELETELKRQILDMVKDEFMTTQEAEVVDISKISRFFKSALGKKMLEANEVKREVPFTIELDLTELYKELPQESYKDEKVLLQGVIDCYIEEDGDLVLLDYKTDYVPEAGTDIIKKRYGIQLDYYTRALEAMTGKKVKQRYIYLFYNGLAVSI